MYRYTPIHESKGFTKLIEYEQLTVWVCIFMYGIVWTNGREGGRELDRLLLKCLSFCKLTDYYETAYCGHGQCDAGA